ncbi:hypothetical protein Xszus_02473 [Xenorhabdus szentirmaii]|nr:hypothetical protein Xszus_02473 [Xenorhabdus szentirmaii]
MGDYHLIYYDSPDGSITMTNTIVFSNVNVNRKKELIEYVESIGFKKYFDKYWNEEYWGKDNVRISIKQSDAERTIWFLVEIN